MAWIESHQELARHPKTKRLARELGEALPTTIGRLHLLWWWAMDYAQDGNLERYDAVDVADAVMWDGDPEKLLEAMYNVGFLEYADGIYHIHDWYEYAGQLIEQRKKNAERKRKSREKKKAETKDVQESPEDVTGMSQVRTEDIHESHRATRPDQTVPNQTKEKDKRESSSIDPKLGELVKLFESEGFGTITSTVAEQISSLYDEFTYEWVSNAMKESVISGKRSLSFVRGILRNWKREGGMRLSTDKGKVEPFQHRFGHQSIPQSTGPRVRSGLPPEAEEFIKHAEQNS